MSIFLGARCIASYMKEIKPTGVRLRGFTVPDSGV